MNSWKSSKRSCCFRFTALVVASIFAWTHIAGADTPSLISSFSRENKISSGIKDFNSSWSLPAFMESVQLPDSIGQIKKAHIGPKNQIVIHIQDAHVHEEAQRNIAQILNYFASHHQLRWVNLEGAEGELYPELFSFFPDKKAVRTVADHFLAWGRLSGPEYLSITETPDLKLYGIENRKVYEQNRQAYLQALPLKSKDEKILFGLEKVLIGVARFVFSDELRELVDRQMNFARQDGQHLVEYAKYLNAKAKKYNVRLEDYSAIESLLILAELENKIDFEKAQDQLNHLGENLKQLLPPAKFNEFLSKTQNLNSKKIKRGDYYQYLQGILEAVPDFKKDHQNLLHYFRYLELFDQFSITLFDQISALEQALKEKLFRSDEERQMDRLFSIFQVYQKMFDFSLTKSEADFFYRHRSEFNVKTFEEFLEPLLRRYHFAYGLPENFEDIDRDLLTVEAFYKIALRRDPLLIQNAIRKMRSENQNLTAIVTGGFHTPGIEQYLEKHGYSYLVISPRMTTLPDATKESQLYEDALRLKTLPVEEQLLSSLLPSNSKTSLNDPRFQLAAWHMVMERKEAVRTFLGIRQSHLTEKALNAWIEKNPAKALSLFMLQLIALESIFESPDKNLDQIMEGWNKSLVRRKDKAILTEIIEMLKGGKYFQYQQTKFFLFAQKKGEKHLAIARYPKAVELNQEIKVLLAPLSETFSLDAGPYVYRTAWVEPEKMQDLAVLAKNRSEIRSAAVQKPIKKKSEDDSRVDLTTIPSQDVEDAKKDTVRDLAEPKTKTGMTPPSGIVLIEDETEDDQSEEVETISSSAPSAEVETIVAPPKPAFSPEPVAPKSILSPPTSASLQTLKIQKQLEEIQGRASKVLEASKQVKQLSQAEPAVGQLTMILEKIDQALSFIQLREKPKGAAAQSTVQKRADNVSEEFIDKYIKTFGFSEKLKSYDKKRFAIQKRIQEILQGTFYQNDQGKLMSATLAHALTHHLFKPNSGEFRDEKVADRFMEFFRMLVVSAIHGQLSNSEDDAKNKNAFIFKSVIETLAHYEPDSPGGNFARVLEALEKQRAKQVTPKTPVPAYTTEMIKTGFVEALLEYGIKEPVENPKTPGKFLWVNFYKDLFQELNDQYDKKLLTVEDIFGFFTVLLPQVKYGKNTPEAIQQKRLIFIQTLEPYRQKTKLNAVKRDLQNSKREIAKQIPALLRKVQNAAGAQLRLAANAAKDNSRETTPYLQLAKNILTEHDQLLKKIEVSVSRPANKFKDDSRQVLNSIVKKMQADAAPVRDAIHKMSIKKKAVPPKSPAKKTVPKKQKISASKGGIQISLGEFFSLSLVLVGGIGMMFAAIFTALPFLIGSILLLTFGVWLLLSIVSTPPRYAMPKEAKEVEGLLKRLEVSVMQWVKTKKALSSTELTDKEKNELKEKEQEFGRKTKRLTALLREKNKQLESEVKGPRFARPPTRGLSPRAGTAPETPGKPGAPSAVKENKRSEVRSQEPEDEKLDDILQEIKKSQQLLNHLGEDAQEGTSKIVTFLKWAMLPLVGGLLLALFGTLVSKNNQKNKTDIDKIFDKDRESLVPSQDKREARAKEEAPANKPDWRPKVEKGVDPIVNPPVPIKLPIEVKPVEPPFDEPLIPFKRQRPAVNGDHAALVKAIDRAGDASIHKLRRLPGHILTDQEIEQVRQLERNLGFYIKKDSKSGIYTPTYYSMNRLGQPQGDAGKQQTAERLLNERKLPTVEYWSELFRVLMTEQGLYDIPDAKRSLDARLNFLKEMNKALQTVKKDFPKRNAVGAMSGTIRGAALDKYRLLFISGHISGEDAALIDRSWEQLGLRHGDFHIQELIGLAYAQVITESINRYERGLLKLTHARVQEIIANNQFPLFIRDIKRDVVKGRIQDLIAALGPTAFMDYLVVRSRYIDPYIDVKLNKELLPQGYEVQEEQVFNEKTRTWEKTGRLVFPAHPIDRFLEHKHRLFVENRFPYLGVRGSFRELIRPEFFLLRDSNELAREDAALYLELALSMSDWVTQLPDESFRNWLRELGKNHKNIGSPGPILYYQTIMNGAEELATRRKKDSKIEAEINDFAKNLRDETLKRKTEGKEVPMFSEGVYHILAESLYEFYATSPRIRELGDRRLRELFIGLTNRQLEDEFRILFEREFGDFFKFNQDIQKDFNAGFEKAKSNNSLLDLFLEGREAGFFDLRVEKGRITSQITTDRGLSRAKALVDKIKSPSVLRGFPPEYQRDFVVLLRLIQEIKENPKGFEARRAVDLQRLPNFAANIPQPAELELELANEQGNARLREQKLYGRLILLLRNMVLEVYKNNRIALLKGVYDTAYEKTLDEMEGQGYYLAVKEIPALGNAQPTRSFIWRRGNPQAPKNDDPEIPQQELTKVLNPIFDRYSRIAIERELRVISAEAANRNVVRDFYGRQLNLSNYNDSARLRTLMAGYVDRGMNPGQIEAILRETIELMERPLGPAKAVAVIAGQPIPDPLARLAPLFVESNLMQYARILDQGKGLFAGQWVLEAKSVEQTLLDKKGFYRLYDRTKDKTEWRQMVKGRGIVAGPSAQDFREAEEEHLKQLKQSEVHLGFLLSHAEESLLKGGNYDTSLRARIQFLRTPNGLGERRLNQALQIARQYINLKRTLLEPNVPRVPEKVAFFEGDREFQGIVSAILGEVKSVGPVAEEGFALQLLYFQQQIQLLRDYQKPVPPADKNAEARRAAAVIAAQLAQNPENAAGAAAQLGILENEGPNKHQSFRLPFMPIKLKADLFSPTTITFEEKQETRHPIEWGLVTLAPGQSTKGYVLAEEIVRKSFVEIWNLEARWRPVQENEWLLSSREEEFNRLFIRNPQVLEDLKQETNTLKDEIQRRERKIRIQEANKEDVPADDRQQLQTKKTEFERLQRRLHFNQEYRRFIEELPVKSSYRARYFYHLYEYLREKFPETFSEDIRRLTQFPHLSNFLALHAKIDSLETLSGTVLSPADLDLNYLQIRKDRLVDHGSELRDFILHQEVKRDLRTAKEQLAVARQFLLADLQLEQTSVVRSEIRQQAVVNAIASGSEMRQSTVLFNILKSSKRAEQLERKWEKELAQYFQVELDKQGINPAAATEAGGIIYEWIPGSTHNQLVLLNSLIQNLSQQVEKTRVSLKLYVYLNPDKLNAAENRAIELSLQNRFGVYFGTILQIKHEGVLNDAVRSVLKDLSIQDPQHVAQLTGTDTILKIKPELLRKTFEDMVQAGPGRVFVLSNGKVLISGVTPPTIKLGEFFAQKLKAVKAISRAA